MTKETLFELWKKVNAQLDIIKSEQKEYVRGVEKGMDLMYDEVRKYFDRDESE